jgi:hypothetical protein
MLIRSSTTKGNSSVLLLIDLLYSSKERDDYKVAEESRTQKY